MNSRADYGIDAPPVVRNLALGGGALIILGILAFQYISKAGWLRDLSGSWGIFAGGFMILQSSLMIWTSKVGKLRTRVKLIDGLHLKGNEIILDLGCGRGLLMIEAAKHLPAGKAIGIDLWQSVDQSGNRPEVARANAEAEGVADRVEIKSGDMRELPFPDSSVDVVVASMSIHNIPGTDGRAQAIRELHRVLKPGGKIALQDFRCTDEYLATLQSLGWKDASRSTLSFAMIPPVRVLTGSKPK